MANGARTKESLTERKCVPCEGGIPALSGTELNEYAGMLDGYWRVVDDHHLEKRYTFKDFQTALEFTNQVGTLAEQEDHHPEICMGWGYVKIQLWTHAVGGLTENDFILAAKISESAGG